MKKYIGIGLSMICLYSSTGYTINVRDISADLPTSTHLYPNRSGGYSYIDSGNQSSNNILDRLPQTHTINPDGRGGYYVR